MDSLQVFLVEVYLPDYYQLPALPLGSLVELDLVAVLVPVAAVAVVMMTKVMSTRSTTAAVVAAVATKHTLK